MKRSTAFIWAAYCAATLAATAQLHAQYTDVADEASLVSLWQLDETAGSGTVSATNANPVYDGTVFAGTTLGAVERHDNLGDGCQLQREHRQNRRALQRHT